MIINYVTNKFRTYGKFFSILKIYSHDLAEKMSHWCYWLTLLLHRTISKARLLGNINYTNLKKI